MYLEIETILEQIVGELRGKPGVSYFTKGKGQM